MKAQLEQLELIADCYSANVRRDKETMLEIKDILISRIVKTNVSKIKN